MERDKSMKLQSQIRQNAEEMSTYMSDLQKWEKSVSTKDKQLAQKHVKEPRNFLRGSNKSEIIDRSTPQLNANVSTDFLTPASLVDQHVTYSVSSASVPKASTEVSSGSMELKVRELGNEQYQKGNFAEAAKQYTKCIGLKVN